MRIKITHDHNQWRRGFEYDVGAGVFDVLVNRRKIAVAITDRDNCVELKKPSEPVKRGRGRPRKNQV